ncbi:MAG: phosphopantothenoylcysteine decarboxylase [Chlamydiae bacterium]|nr:phosphopantothenoylcysteine decarboxylase [Chlamydiota bacterium]MBI3266102.1 phosphopantothenoylcysteine decarboxylase [Chlamydiota bacterium]
MPVKFLPRILVTAGPTREFLDPTRFLSNPSSGKMGYCIADEACKQGCSVTLISGPVSLTPLPIKMVHVISAREMFQTVKKYFHTCDVLIMTAAVSDYRPGNLSRHKLKKKKSPQTLALIPNPDILAWAGAHKKNQRLIGFAAETDHLLENARKKMLSKNLDMIVANRVGHQACGFESDKIEFAFLTPDQARISHPDFKIWTKRKLARELIQKAVKLYGH